MEPISDFISQQQDRWIGHCIRTDDETYIKRLTFADYFKNEAKKKGPLNTTYSQVLKRYTEEGCTEQEMILKLKVRNSR